MKALQSTGTPELLFEFLVKDRLLRTLLIANALRNEASLNELMVSDLIGGSDVRKPVVSAACLL